jgi:hypothetical protein
MLILPQKTLIGVSMDPQAFQVEPISNIMSPKNVTKVIINMVSGVGCQSPGSKVQRSKVQRLDNSRKKGTSEHGDI